MSDYKGSLGIKSQRDDDVKIILVDGASGDTATKKLSIAGVGDAISAGTNDYGVPFLVKDDGGNYALMSVDASGNLLIAGTVAISGAVDVTGSSVSISGSVAVTATDLDIRNLAHTQDSVKIGDGTNLAAVNASGELSIDLVAQSATGSAVPAQAVMVGGKDGSGNLRALATDASGQLQVVVVSESAPGKVVDYATSAALAASTSANHDYIVTDTKTFKGKKILAAGLEAIKCRVGTYNGTTFSPKYVAFAQPGVALEIDICLLELLGDTTNAIRVEITNLGGDASDVYSTIQGTEE